MSLTDLPDQNTAITRKSDSVEQQLHHLFEQVPSAIVIFNGPDAIIELANKKAVEIIGRPKEKLIGHKLGDALPELRDQGYIDMVKKVYNSGETFISDESPVTFLSGGKRTETFVKYIFQPLEDQAGNIIGVMVVGDDVSQQVAARRKIEESANKIRTLNEKLETELAAIRELQDINNKFSADEDSGIVYDSLLESAMRLMSSDFASLQLYDPVSETLLLVNHKNFHPKSAEFWQRVSAASGSVCGKALRYNSPIMVGDIEKEEFAENELEIFRLSGIRAVQSRPLISRNGNLIGMINIQWKDPRVFSIDDDRLFDVLAGQAATFIDQRQTEKVLRESEEINRLFIEHAPAAMAMFDREMRYVSVSKQWMKEYDLSGDIIGKKHYELFPNILQRWKDVHARCMAGAIETSDEDFYVKDNGTPIWLKWKVYPWHKASKEIGGIVIFTENVTEQKIAERNIKESEERFRAMANEAPLFVWVTDENLQTTYLNKAGLDYFGLDESLRISELSWKKYIHPGDIEKVLTIMHDAASKHESYTLEMRLKNGLTDQYHWFLDRGAPRYINDKFTGFIGTSLDIHDRKEAEQELENKVKQRTRELDQQNVLLKKQNTLVKKIWDSSVDLIAVYDIDTRLISANEASLRVMRVNEEAFGKKILEILPGIKNTQGYSDLIRAIAGETIHNEVYQSPITHRYYENSLIPLRDDNDNVYAVLAMAHDNTDLISSAKKLNEAQQIAQIGHWDWEVASNKLIWSDNLYNIFGLKPDENISFEKFVTHIHPDDRANMHVNIEFALQSQIFNDFFHRIITPSGEEKIIHARGEVIVDKNGKVIRMVGTGQDVTRQKLIEQKLIETSKQFEERNQFIEQLINSSLDLIMVIDKDLRFITMNKKAQVLYQDYYKENIIGKRITDLDPPVKGTENYNDIMEAFSGKIIIKDKVKSTISENFYEHNYVPLTNSAGEVYAVMIISHDITESIRQMEELRKLSESDVQKNNFIAMASHELKTPITSIKGYVQLLLNAVTKEKDEKKALPPLLVRSSLISVDKQITRLTRLISELLDLSKIETGTLELKKEKFKLNELAIETVEDILYTNTKHQINLYHDYEGYVFADKDRIGQVMINFLTNAIKYSPNSGKIDVYVNKRPGNSIAFSVRDYGIGIDKEEQKRIFERFYRARGKEEQTYPGFGIGLFIANEFVQKHGGSMVVESEKGKGSVFTFILPVYTN